MAEAQALVPNLFKRNLAAKKKQIGMWLSTNSPIATEILAWSGYDWLLLDMEHACIDPSQVAQHLTAARGGTAELVVRIPSNDPVLLKRLLDAGVRSIMVPWVQSAAEASAAVAATRYPPQGIRGAAGNTRASNFGRIASYFSNYKDEQCVVVQIETTSAVKDIEAIAAVDGIDGLFIGPNDLATNMGYLAKPGTPEVQATIRSALERIRATGKASGILNFTPPEARALLESGVCFIAVASDASVLVRRSEALLAELKAPT
jgi:4-hydroxy-2-oxoheptanedioate aldolase